MLAYDPSTNPLNNNEWSFPVTEVIHIASMTMALGTIALIDLKLISPGLLTRKPSQLLRDTEIMTLIGLFIVIASGIVIWTTDPEMYLQNEGFLFKMAVLAAAIVFNYTIHRWVVKSDATGLIARLVGVVSLVLWIGAPFGGIFTAFV
jgi:hypothetical protein